MKRPPIFCLVATWCCLGMLMQTAHLAPPPPWDFLPLVAVCFLIWQTVHQKVSDKKILSDIHDLKADCENNPCQGEEP